MHDSDFQLTEKEEFEDGRIRFCVQIKAMGLERLYEYDPRHDSIQLIDDPLIVGGHDMTSITGKRVREWLRSTELAD